MEFLKTFEATGDLDPLSISHRRSRIIAEYSVDLTRLPSLSPHTCVPRALDIRFGGAVAAAAAATATAAAAARIWRSPGLTYEFAPKFPEAAKAAVSRAFIPWEGPLNFTFTQSSSRPGTADIYISMYEGIEDGELAHAYLPPHGAMNFNSPHPWWCNLAPPPKHCYDFQSVAVHEIGHLLGLEHSDDPDSAMFGFIGPGEVRRGLTRDDADALKRLYLLDYNYNFL